MRWLGAATGAARLRILATLCAVVLLAGVAAAVIGEPSDGDEVASVGDERRRGEEDERPAGRAGPSGVGASTTAAGAPSASTTTSAPVGAAPQTGAGEPDAITIAPTPDGGDGALPPIRIGVVGTFCCTFGSFGGGYLESGRAVLEAWAALVNTNGGLAGHPVEVVAAAMTGSSADGEDPYRQLVEQERVIAFVGDFNSTTQLPVDYLESVGVPVLAPAITVSAYDSPIVFPVGGGTASIAEGLAGVAVANGWDDVAVVRCTDAHCHDVGEAFRSAAAAAGVHVSRDVQVPLTTTNPPGCAGEAMVVLGPAGFVERWVTGCEQPVITSSVALSDRAVEDGTWAVTTVLPHMVASTPGGSLYRALLERVPESYTSVTGEERPLVEGFATSGAFASAMLLDRAAAGGGWGAEVTSADLIQSLSSLGGDTLGGLVPPLDIRPGAPPVDPGCSYAITAASGRWAAPIADMPSC